MALTGTAKPMPANAPDGLVSAVLIPSSRPVLSSNEPPELPGLTFAWTSVEGKVNLLRTHLRPGTGFGGRSTMPVAAGDPAVEWRIASDVVELKALGEAKISVFTFVARSAYRKLFPISMRVTDTASPRYKR